MSISGKQTINIGLPNESAGSDSLYTAFNKVEQNFTTLFANASPYNTFVAGAGVQVATTSANGTVIITNTGVTNIVAGTNIVLSQANGNVTISSTGGGNGGGTVTSVGIIPTSSSRITVTGSPVVSSGNIFLDLAPSGVVPGSYTNPNVTVDSYGRVTTMTNGASLGTVTSVGLVPGVGIQISGGPITSNGNIIVTNVGVTRLTAGTGITLSGSTGNVTVSAATTGGTVTAVGISSSQLVVSGSPVVSSGTITINLPANAVFSGSVTTNSLVSNGTMILSGSEDLAANAAANLSTVASYFTTSAAETATLAAGTEGQIKTFMMKGDGGDMVITVTNAGWKSSGAGTMTFSAIGQGCILQYTGSKWFCVGNNGVSFG